MHIFFWRKESKTRHLWSLHTAPTILWDQAKMLMVSTNYKNHLNSPDRSAEQTWGTGAYPVYAWEGTLADSPEEGTPLLAAPLVLLSMENVAVLLSSHFDYFSKDKHNLLPILVLKELWCSAWCVLKAQNIWHVMETVLHFDKIFNIYRGTAGIKKKKINSLNHSLSRAT